jgi:site-specific recombinase XerD
MTTTTLPPDWQVLVDGWLLTLASDGYSPKSVSTYRAGLQSLTDWLQNRQESEMQAVGPLDLTRHHIRGWLAHVRERNGATTAKTYFAGVRHFCRWLVAEGETTTDATAGVKTPVPSEPATPVLSAGDLKRLLKTCEGTDFANRRDTAVLLVLADGGLRLAELCGLKVGDVDMAARVLLVAGKGTQRGGPRHRAVPFGIRTAQALNRYLRHRARHPYAASPMLWLGAQGRAVLRADGVVELIRRHGTRAGLEGLHPHVFRHTWASQFRAAGGSEGDLMVLGGWRNRAMLDRYGKSAAAGRAAESYRRLSLGDRL